MEGSALLLRADARRIPLADESVDLVVCSPPFWNLRAYADGGEPVREQLGAEPTAADYLAALWAVTRECARVLKPSGSLWIELGDSYANRATPERNASTEGVGQKSLLGLPWAYALGCTGQLAALGGADPGLGLLLRAEVVWAKPSGMPESVRDRVSRKHSTLFHLTKAPRYYSAVDEIRERYAQDTAAKYAAMGEQGWNLTAAPHRQTVQVDYAGVRLAPNPLGKLPGSVWSIAAEPLVAPAHLGVEHYAAWPSELVRRIVLGWSPALVCTVCGQGRVPVTDRRGAGGIRGSACACCPSTLHSANGSTRRRAHNPVPDARPQGTYGRHQAGEYAHVGAWREWHLDRWEPPPARRAVVLDPFVGSGTTVAVARTLGRVGIGCDLSADYLRLAHWRVACSALPAKVAARTWAERQEPLW